jgi:hypothetical protein
VGPEAHPVGLVQRLRKTWRGLAVNGALLAVLLLVAEGGLRVLGIHFPAIGRVAGDRALWRYHPMLGWDNRPGAVGRSFLGGPDAGDVRIDSLGLRGPERATRKPAGVRRVLVFGDSFVFGVGVDEPHLLTSELQRLLDRTAPGRYEVLNLGVSGYSTDQQYLLLQERGLALGPDIAVLVACDNDFAANLEDFAYGHYYKPYFVSEESGKLRLGHSPVPTLGAAQRVKLWLGQRSELWNAVRSRRSELPWLQRTLASMQVARPRRSREDPVGLTAALVLAFRDLVERAGGRLVLLNTGHRGEQTPLFHELRKLLRPTGLAFLGLEESLAEARRRAPELAWDFDRDPHWNVAAHELVARVIHAFLVAEGLLPSAPDDVPLELAPAG